jgi:CheY-like chemotaxis protein
LVRLLEKQGCQVETAADGREAVAAVERGGFEAVLMDIQMPEMDGFEAIRCIRLLEQRCGRERLPVIVITANAREEDRRAAFEAGADEFMAKPFDAVRLAELLAAPNITGKIRPD